MAWEQEGKQHFNQCRRCGRWVSDVMYNADVLECVGCTPWENVPKYCARCGKKLPPGIPLARSVDFYPGSEEVRTMPDHNALRIENMQMYGFGPDIMKRSKSCRVCGSTCAASDAYCDCCGTVLPRETLFDVYKANHLYCPACDTVVPETTVFCPECGRRLRRQTQLNRTTK